MPDSAAITRPEFDRALNDIELLKAGHVEMRTMLVQQGVEQARQSTMLQGIKDSIDEDKRLRKSRDDERNRARLLQNQTIRNTVIAVNSIGMALLPILVVLLQHAVQHWIGK